MTHLRRRGADQRRRLADAVLFTIVYLQSGQQPTPNTLAAALTAGTNMAITAIAANILNLIAYAPAELAGNIPGTTDATSMKRVESQGA